MFIFFLEENRQTIQKLLIFRKLTQIAIISMVLELNYHKNSQRYIEFNFDHKNNYFRLKSEIVRKKVQNWYLIKPNHLEEGEVVTRFPYCKQGFRTVGEPAEGSLTLLTIRDANFTRGQKRIPQ